MFHLVGGGGRSEINHLFVSSFKILTDTTPCVVRAHCHAQLLVHLGLIIPMYLLEF